MQTPTLKTINTDTTPPTVPSTNSDPESEPEQTVQTTTISSSTDKTKHRVFVDLMETTESNHRRSDLTDAASSSSTSFDDVVSWFRAGDANSWIVVVCVAVILLLTAAIVALFVNGARSKRKFAIDHGFLPVEGGEDSASGGGEMDDDENRASTSTQVGPS